MLEINLVNTEIIRIDAEDLDFEIDADGDLRVKISDEYVAYYPAGQWRNFVVLKADDTKTIAGMETTYKIVNHPKE